MKSKKAENVEKLISVVASDGTKGGAGRQEIWEKSVRGRQMAGFHAVGG